MLRESIAILVLSVMIFIILLRSKHLGYAVACIPIGIIPAAHLLVSGILYFMGPTVFGVRTAAIRGFADMLAVVASIIAIVLISRKIQAPTNQKIYLVALSLYVLVLGWVYIWESLKVIIR